MVGHYVREKLAKKNSFKQLGKLLKEGLSSTEISTDQEFTYRPKKRGKPGANEAFDFLSLIQSWPDIIGPRLSKHCIPLKNTKRSLTILTDHPAYSEQLKFMEIQLLEKIKTKFPSLRNSLRTLYFKTDSTFFQKQKLIAEQRAGIDKVQEEKIEKAFHKYSPEYRKLKLEADEEFKDIESDEVRDRLTSIYIQSRQTE
ncbi:MAG: hypothetical protein CME70_00715 [Halobacteriovorax sp.]|nr:hypothetical protein [Halobacteriovorax sp.]|tara:strand:- start:88125 stop:88721 length:597 start_codon:yes stop_codon:yes gene_type:complete